MTEPFLIVGLIAPIRRLLVITLEASVLTTPEAWSAGNGPRLLRAYMTELGLLAVVILVFVVSICWMRTHTGNQEDPS
ncbi:MAG: hypothetical protein PVS2B2_25820 [Candidatus Acidiferrum sp.]